jgi:hypothetical protein
MANYCGNLLTIESDDAGLIDRLITIASPSRRGFASKLIGRMLGKSNETRIGLLEFLMPMPEPLKATITNGFTAATPAWYQWQLDNWGCAHDVAVDAIKRTGPAKVEFGFYSRYSPPIGALMHGSRKHNFKFRMVYCETGNQFAGILTEQDHAEFEFTFDVPPIEEGVPQEIVTHFNLNSIYEELLNDS